MASKFLSPYFDLSVEAMKPYLTNIDIHKVLLLLGGVFTTSLCLFVTLCIYNAFFHPLSRFPGPKTWGATRFIHSYYIWKGTFIYKTADLHNTYGPVVRIAPDEISYIKEEAWNEIYGFRVGKSQLRKDPRSLVVGPGGEYGIISADDANHARMRRNLTNAFSEKALRDQEQLMTQYFERLVEKLREIADKGEKTNMVSWLNFTTFDIIGDLTLGAFFDSLNTGKDWIKAISLFAKEAMFSAIPRKHKAVAWLIKRFIPQELLDAKRGHNMNSTEQLDIRLATMDVQRPDFMSPVIAKFGTPLGFSHGELGTTTATILLAGSETTATTLAAALYFLTTNPDCLDKVTKEIRSSYTSSDEIGITSANNLKYQLAVLDETLRLFPPVPGGDSVRITSADQGDTILGEQLPPNTRVSIKQYAANHSETNFKRPKEFLPERWLGDPEFENDKRKVVQPFSAGPRNCLGRNLAYAEMRVILAKILYNFDVELCEESKDWMKGMKSYSLWAKPELMMKVKRRVF